jgi:hypothetical protein
LTGCSKTISVLANPSRRRQWLLLLALETSPLDEALRVARAAEKFLSGALRPSREVYRSELARPIVRRASCPMSSAERLQDDPNLLWPNTPGYLQ